MPFQYSPEFRLQLCERMLAGERISWLPAAAAIIRESARWGFSFRFGAFRQPLHLGASGWSCEVGRFSRRVQATVWLATPKRGQQDRHGRAEHFGIEDHCPQLQDQRDELADPGGQDHEHERQVPLLGSNADRVAVEASSVLLDAEGHSAWLPGPHGSYGLPRRTLQVARDTRGAQPRPANSPLAGPAPLSDHHFAAHAPEIHV